MYSNLAKGQLFPLATRVSLKPRCLKPQFLPIGCHSKPSLNPLGAHFTTLSHGFGRKSHKVCSFVKPSKTNAGFQWKDIEMGAIARAKSISGGFRIRTVLHCSARSFSRSFSQSVDEGSGVVRAGKSLPWLNSKKVKGAKGLEKGAGGKSSPIRGESVKRLEKVGGDSSWVNSRKRLEKGTVAAETGYSSWEDSWKRLEEVAVGKNDRSSWEDVAEAASGSENIHKVWNKESTRRRVGDGKNKLSGHGYTEGEDSVEGGEAEEDLEVVDDPRWDKIKNRFRGRVGVRGQTEKPDSQRWSRQDNWGRKTWKEATELTVPKIVGEGVFGVGPVLAALSTGRREFYALYIQEGLDLSGNNKKKKDKKGFEKVLRMAKKIGLSTKEVSKHDLNMIVDNRPHQGLVLDASPLEMVKIQELDAVLPDEEKGSLWVALDEVTDPQNLGAIVRSAYFFGASGVVLCAKNSAPLSGVVSKASAGSLELMELRYCKNMMQFLVSSAENGWRVLGGSVSSKAVSLIEVLPGQPTILVLGSEGTGLRPLVERSCTQLVRIPGNIPVDATVGGGDVVEGEEINLECSSAGFRSFLAVESLNVSVAAGVLLHHLIGNNNENHNSIGPTS
uniref:rRNA methyltransferase 1, mitochondrial n=1 Tax=Salix viminalis TaxID=40686 RepID=A0A6N2KRF8_SALVM